jgi:hypothetical protein
MILPIASEGQEPSTADAWSRLRPGSSEEGQRSDDMEMDRSVAESWALIVGWLEQNLPTAFEVLQPPAPWSAVSAVREGMGRRLPSDLLAWLNLNNGIKRRGGFGNILPTLHTPLPCEEMLPRREMLRSIYADLPRPGELEPAGTRSSEWLSSFLPISDAGTDVELSSIFERATSTVVSANLTRKWVDFGCRAGRVRWTCCPTLPMP